MLDKLPSSVANPDTLVKRPAPDEEFIAAVLALAGTDDKLVRLKLAVEIDGEVHRYGMAFGAADLHTFHSGPQQKALQTFHYMLQGMTAHLRRCKEHGGYNRA